jgi:hypothetical protein
MRIVWEYVETYNHDEPITCLCDNEISPVTDEVSLITCGKCKQELRIMRTTYKVHEVYAKKEVADGKDRNDETSTKEPEEG